MKGLLCGPEVFISGGGLCLNMCSSAQVPNPFALELFVFCLTCNPQYVLCSVTGSVCVFLRDQNTKGRRQWWLEQKTDSEAKKTSSATFASFCNLDICTMISAPTGLRRLLIDRIPKYFTISFECPPAHHRQEEAIKPHQIHPPCEELLIRVPSPGENCQRPSFLLGFCFWFC